MKALNTIDRWVMRIEEILSETLLAFIIIFVFIAAFLRVIRMPLVWSVDMAQLLFVWVCFIGADLAMAKDKHIGVDLLTNLLPKKTQTAIKVVSNLLAMAFLCLIAVYGTKLAIINVKDQFSGMELSHSWATASAPVGCALMLRTLVKKTAGLLRPVADAKAAAA